MRWEGLTMFSKRSQRGTQYHGRPLGQAPGPIIFGGMCGRVRLSSDVSEIKLIFSIPAHRPTPNSTACRSAFQWASSGKVKNNGASDRALGCNCVL